MLGLREKECKLGNASSCHVFVFLEDNDLFSMLGIIGYTQVLVPNE